MNKLMIRRVLNLLLWLSVCFLAATGFALAWKFPHGHRGSATYTLLGVSPHLWKQLHIWVGVGFAVLVLAHIYMAWPWLKSAAAGKKRLWAVLAGLIVGLVLPAALLLSPVKSQPTTAPAITSTAPAGHAGGASPREGTGQGNRWGKQGN